MTRCLIEINSVLHGYNPNEDSAGCCLCFGSSSATTEVGHFSIHYLLTMYTAICVSHDSKFHLNLLLKLCCDFIPLLVSSQTLESLQDLVSSFNNRFASGQGLAPGLGEAGLCAAWSLWSLGSTDAERVSSVWLEVALVPVDVQAAASKAREAQRLRLGCQGQAPPGMSSNTFISPSLLPPSLQSSTSVTTASAHSPASRKQGSRKDLSQSSSRDGSTSADGQPVESAVDPLLSAEHASSENNHSPTSTSTHSSLSVSRPARVPAVGSHSATMMAVTSKFSPSQSSPLAASLGTSPRNGTAPLFRPPGPTSVPVQVSNTPARLRGAATTDALGATPSTVNTVPTSLAHVPASTTGSQLSVGWHDGVGGEPMRLRSSTVALPMPAEGLGATRLHSHDTTSDQSQQDLFQGPAHSSSQQQQHSDQSQSEEPLSPRGAPQDSLHDESPATPPGPASARQAFRPSTASPTHVRRFTESPINRGLFRFSESVHDHINASAALLGSSADADADADLDAILQSTPRRDGVASAASSLPPSSYHPGSGLASLATSLAPSGSAGSYLGGHGSPTTGPLHPLGSHPRAIPASLRGARPSLGGSVSATPSAARRGYVNLAESPRQDAAYAQYQQVQQAGGSLAPVVNLFPPSMGGLTPSMHSPQLSSHN